MQMTTFWMAGWIQDECGWTNFLKVRLEQKTQRESRLTAEAINELIFA